MRPDWEVMDKMILRPDPQEIGRAVSLLFRQGDVVEVRVPKTRQGTISGYFDNPADLVEAVTSLNGAGPGVYVSLNPVNPAILARAQNHLKNRAEETTTDKDILKRGWLLVDCDPVRPRGISATDPEHAAALKRTVDIAGIMRQNHRWPAPALADSGNGGHAVYRLDLPNDEDSRKLIERVLKAMAARFDDAVVAVDVTVFNASRIVKLWGTVAAKGDDTPERPHRLSRLLEVPEVMEVVSRELLEEFAGPEAPPREPPPPRNSCPGAYDVSAWIERNHLEVSLPESHKGGRKWALLCPFNPEHKDAAIFESADGRPGFHCFHESCKDKGWQALAELIEGPRTTSANDSQGPIRSIEDLESIFADQTPAKFLIEPELPERTIVYLAGDSESGKSTLACAWARDVLRAGHAVLILDSDKNPRERIRDRFHRLGQGEHPRLKVWDSQQVSDVPQPNAPIVVDWVKRMLAETGKSPMVILDSLIGFLRPGESENDSVVMRGLFNRARVLNSLGATVVLIHYTGKNGETRGSSDFRPAGDQGFIVSNYSPDGSGLLFKITLKVHKNRYVTGPIVYYYADGSFTRDGSHRETPDAEVERLTSLLRTNPGITFNKFCDLATEHNLNRDRARTWLSNGVMTGIVRWELGSHNSHRHFLAADEANSSVRTLVFEEPDHTV
jgi:hypothetical protein